MLGLEYELDSAAVVDASHAIAAIACHPEFSSQIVGNMCGSQPQVLLRNNIVVMLPSRQQ